MPKKLLNDGQRSPALDLAQCPPVPEPMRVDPLLDTGLRRESLAERAHVAVPQRLAVERAEEGVPSGEPKALSTFEPAIDGVGRVAGQRGRACLVTFAVKHTERAACWVEVFGEQCECLRDAQPRTVEDGQQGAVADAGRRAARAGGAEGLHVGEREGLGGESAGRLSLHTHQTVLERIQCRFVEVPTLYAAR